MNLARSLWFLSIFLPAISLAADAGPDSLHRDFSNASWLPKLELLAIQSGGRVKPFDTFAREGVQLLTGKSR